LAPGTHSTSRAPLSLAARLATHDLKNSTWTRDIAQRAETVATLGGRLPLSDTFSLSLGGHAGLMMVWGWPRGLLRDLHGELGPWLGAHLAADWRLSPRWALAPRVSLGTVRLLQSWLLVPGAGLDLVWRFGA
jgi:hypothetical protein